MFDNRARGLLTLGVIVAFLVGVVAPVGIGTVGADTDDEGASANGTTDANPIADANETSDANETADGAVNGTQVRAMHVAPNLPALDVLVDGEPIATNISFVGFTEYQSVEPGNATIQLRANESGDVLYEENATLEPNTSYSVLGAATTSEDGTADPAVSLLTDNVTAPSEENATLRFVHATPDAPPLTVTLDSGETTVAENVSFQNASEYVTVPAGNYTLEVGPAGDEIGELLVQRNVTLEGGTAYSVVGLGFLNASEGGEGGEPFPFLIVLTTDAPNESTAGADDENATTNATGAATASAAVQATSNGYIEATASTPV